MELQASSDQIQEGSRTFKAWPPSFGVVWIERVDLTLQRFFETGFQGECGFPPQRGPNPFPSDIQRNHRKNTLYFFPVAGDSASRIPDDGMYR